jgi:hypothetical protein
MGVLHLPVGKNKTRLTVTLESSTAQCIEGLAEKENRTVSAMAAILITEALTNPTFGKNAKNPVKSTFNFF